MKTPADYILKLGQLNKVVTPKLAVSPYDFWR